MKVITFSRHFPATHPRKGAPTWFVEKIWKGLWELSPGSHNPLNGYEGRYNDAFPLQFDPKENIHQHAPKWHTIRGGARWKEGDLFSPRVWTARPYASKQLEFIPPVIIRKVWNFQILLQNYTNYAVYLNGKGITGLPVLDDIARNDGLSTEDFLHWFGVKEGAKSFHFAGQILCWNPDLNYEPCI